MTAAAEDPLVHPPCRPGAGGSLSDGLALAQHAVGFVQFHTGILLTPAAREELVEVVVGLVAQLEEWAADPLGGPPDPWTYLRRRWHRQERLSWWGRVPASTRRMLTGVEPRGRDSLLQVAWNGPASPEAAAVSRWRTALLDFDPSSDVGAVQRLALRRASRGGSRQPPGSPPAGRGMA